MKILRKYLANLLVESVNQIIVVNQLQTRSADEPMTTFVSCQDYGYGNSNIKY